MPPSHTSSSSSGKNREKLDDGKIKKEMKRESIYNDKMRRKKNKNGKSGDGSDRSKSVKEEEQRRRDSSTKRNIQLKDPDIPEPWKVYLSMRKMRCYYFNHLSNVTTWEREDVEKWKKAHNMVGTAYSSESKDMGNIDDDDDVKFIQEIRKESIPVSLPPTSTPSGSGYLHHSADSIAIFDTSALIDVPEILDITVRSTVPYRSVATVVLADRVIAVVPYKVLQELDGLKKSERYNVVRSASKALKSLDELSSKGHPLIILESARELNEPLEGFVVENADDKILKCALRITQFMCNYMRNVWFVSNDTNLRVKCRGCNERIIADLVNGLLKERSEKKKESWCEQKREIKEYPTEENRKEVKRKEKEKEKHQQEVIWEEKVPLIQEKTKKIIVNIDFPSTSNTREMREKAMKREGMNPVNKDNEDDDCIEIIDNPSPEMKEGELEEEDDIIEVDVPRSGICDELWDEYKRPSEVFMMILTQTPSAVYSLFSNRYLNMFIRKKALEDLQRIESGMKNLLHSSWKEDVFMEVYHLLHSLHQYYVVRKPFPPQKLSKESLLADLQTLGKDQLQHNINKIHLNIIAFAPPQDMSLFL